MTGHCQMKHLVITLVQMCQLYLSLNRLLNKLGNFINVCLLREQKWKLTLKRKIKKNEFILKKIYYCYLLSICIFITLINHSFFLNIMIYRVNRSKKMNYGTEGLTSDIISIYLFLNYQLHYSEHSCILWLLKESFHISKIQLL